MARALRTSLISLIVALAAAGSVLAQSGSVTGKVTSTDGGGPLAGATVNLEANGVLAAQGKTRADGSYRISGVAPGSYTVRIRSVGYGPREFPGTVVAACCTDTVDAGLSQTEMRLAYVSVTTAV